MSDDYLNKYLQYITNTGGCVSVENFDEDWEPIGPDVRKMLLEKGLISESAGKIIRNDTE